MVTPASLLLATLYSLTKLSRANEIVSMLTSGLSLPQVLKPLLVVAGWLSLMGMAMNYHLAPRAEGKREAVLRELSEKKQGASLATAVMHRNEKTGRTWYIGKVPFDMINRKMQTIEIRQTDGQGRLKTTWNSKTAKWWAPNEDNGEEHGIWALYHGTERTYKGGLANEEKFFDGSVMEVTRINLMNWPETPYTIISAALLPDNLGVTDLVAYVEANSSLGKAKLAPFRTQFHHRFAYPWQGFVVALMAAPLGVAFSRRGALGGIAASVFIFFSLMFVNEFFLGLGKGSHIAPWLAAWAPHLIIGSIGLVLFRARALNKDLPNLSPRFWWKKVRHWAAPKAGLMRPARA
jgi:lipopolysaccharide export system permease protein